MTQTRIPQRQHALQLVGPDKLELNKSKEVFKPGPHQILAKIECVGLCFSDLKLLKQFSQHARKSEIIGGLAKSILSEIPTYVPGEKATVPGHEVTCRIVAVGDQVSHHKVGERCMVQADYRALPTANSNAAFGYNFEGALQEYVLMDERVVMDQGERYLIPVPEDLGASAIALVEPWACVERSYVNVERQGLKPGGRLVVVLDQESRLGGAKRLASACRAIESIHPSRAGELPNGAFDDVIYFGHDKRTIETLDDKLANRGTMNVVLCGGSIGELVSVGIGRVHYGMTRWVGTTGFDPAESYKAIPATGEVRNGDKIAVIGAGGPMGQMHVIRAVCSEARGITVVGADIDDARLAALSARVQPLADANHVNLRLENTQRHPLNEKFSYWALMAPVGALVAAAVKGSDKNCLINIFAGIPAATKQELDLDAYIRNQCFMFGTSGSEIADMKIVLEKVKSRRLDTNSSVDAISGMAGAADGIAAVENRTLVGKIIVYPMLHDVGLIPLSELDKHFPTVATKLNKGAWCGAAELELLRVAERTVAST